MIEALKKQIEDSSYWDARVKALDCNYFGDEVKLVSIELYIVCSKFTIC